LQSEASQIGRNNKYYNSVNVHFGVVAALTDANKNPCTLAAKSETQQHSVELKYIGVQQQRNKMIIIRVGGSCFEY